MEIKENLTCWLLHTTLINKKGECIDHQVYQHHSSTDMLNLLEDRKKTKAIWETEENSAVKYHLHLTYLLSYGSAGVLARNTNAEELLLAHAKHEQALNTAQS